jgi:hypothetical protein
VRVYLTDENYDPHRDGVDSAFRSEVRVEPPPGSRSTGGTLKKKSLGMASLRANPPGLARKWRES